MPKSVQIRSDTNIGRNPMDQRTVIFKFRMFELDEAKLEVLSSELAIPKAELVRIIINDFLTRSKVEILKAITELNPQPLTRGRKLNAPSPIDQAAYRFE